MFNIRGRDTSAASSLCWKLPYLETVVNQATESYSIISITETWLKPHITDAQVQIKGFAEPYRSDRLKMGRGGCCLYIKKDITVSDSFKYDDIFCQVIGCSLDKLKTLVFSVYTPGDTHHNKFANTINFIQSFLETKDDSWSVIITVDFDFPNIDWETLSINSSESNACRIMCGTSTFIFRIQPPVSSSGKANSNSN